MQNRVVRSSVIDGVLSSQPELGPKIPDGGYGWLVFGATLFFQVFVPSLITVYGIILASVRLNTEKDEKELLYLWDDKFLYVPLFFSMSWIAFDPAARNLISHSTWPRLIGQAGNCLTCAGLLFVWMGMAGTEYAYTDEKVWLILAGLISGIGSSIQVSQCEILLAQYFKIRHLYLTHISYVFVAIGFTICPLIISYLRMRYDLLHVILIYQALLLQGILVSYFFKKPEYLKSKLVHYQYVTENVEDEEDIFSKSLTELRVKTRDVVKTIEIKRDVSETAPASTSHETKKDWVKFNEEETSERRSWERFDDENVHNNNTIQKNVSVENDETTENIMEPPSPLFNDMGVNMNTTYAFDDINAEELGPRSIPSVFPEAEKPPTVNLAMYSRILKTPTFYKSLLTMITTKFSVFVYFALFPSYLYSQIATLRFIEMAHLVGSLSIGALIFSAFSYWLNVNKQRRPIFLFALCLIGANGYFLIAIYKHSEYIVIFGALEIVLSIASLQHIGGPLLGVTIRGESSSEYVALGLLTGFSFLIFCVIDIAFKDCFLMMALLHLITGLLWVANSFYKQIRIY